MSTLGQIIGGIVGAVIGYIAGGPVGAWYGFGIGLGVGAMIDPATPDIPQPGEPMGELEIMTNTEGSPIPDIIGTTKLTGNLFYYGNNRREEVTESADTGGSSSGGSEEYVTGYRYYLSWAMGFCLGPVDAIYTIYFDDTIVWAGAIPISIAEKGLVTIVLAEGDREDVLDWSAMAGLSDMYDGEYGTVIDWGGSVPINPSWGSIGETFLLAKKRESGNYIGLMHFYFGTEDQEPNPWLEELMINEGAIQDDTMSVPYRRQCYAYLDDCYIGEYNRSPTVKIVARKSPTCSFDT